MSTPPDSPTPGPADGASGPDGRDAAPSGPGADRPADGTPNRDAPPPPGGGPDRPRPPRYVAGAEGRVDLGPRQQVRESDLEWTFARGSGPGGQNVNKVASAAELRVAVTAIAGLDDAARARLREQAGHLYLASDDVLVVRSRSHRSQWSNRRTCLERLAELVATAARRPKVRKKTRPSRAARQRRLDEKKQHGEKKRRRGKKDFGW